MAQVTVNDDGVLLSGATLETFVREIAKYAVDVIGLNCSVGPKAMLEALEHLKTLTKLPISVQPNAGVPQNVGGRNIYMTSPEYIAEYAKRFILSGAQVVGGCCGTNPGHIRAIRRAVQALQPSKRMDLTETELKVTAPEAVQVVHRRKNHASATSWSNTSLSRSSSLSPPKGSPPLRRCQSAQTASTSASMRINIPDGPRASARMSALALAAISSAKWGSRPCCISPVGTGTSSACNPTCWARGRSGCRNILAITGDPPKLGNYPNATAVFDVDAIGLTNIINRLNHGLDLAGNPIGEPTAFSIGVGVNPGAINLDEELRRLEWKIEAGAEYMITQPVFDLVAGTVHEAVEHAHLPLICGIWPLVSYGNAEFMNNEVPGASVPPDILARMRKTTTKEEGFREGVAIAKETYERVRPAVAGVQLSAPMGRIEGITMMLE